MNQSTPKMEKSVELIFVPFPAITHLVSSMEFAKVLVRRHGRLRITVLLMKPLTFAAEQREFMRSVSESEPGIRFVELPEIDPPSPEIMAGSPERFVTLFVEGYVDSVREVLAGMVSTRSDRDRVVGLVLDLFCVSMIDVGDELGLPSYIFLTTNAAFLNLMFYIADRELGVFSGTDPGLPVPGFVNPVPPKTLPRGLFDGSGREAYVKIARRFRDVKGIFVNSFVELESHAFACFYDEEFQSRNRNPPVYAVGPIIDLESRAHPVIDRDSHDKLIGWLDDQPSKSVVFLCFGSMGRFGAPQTREIAIALERSGYRFVWTIQEPPTATEVLPEGFLERVGGRGMICKWAPQVEVLAHEAVGGFVSHCGWNSILESLWNRVPVATWPLYAEQQLNAFLMVKELGGLAVEMSLVYRNNGGAGDLVCADEIERAVRRLMNGDGDVREKVNEMGSIARRALIDGGSSFVSIGRLLDDIVAKS